MSGRTYSISEDPRYQEMLTGVPWSPPFTVAGSTITFTAPALATIGFTVTIAAPQPSKRRKGRRA